ncbi:MAG: hypothetical protein F6J93_25930 [Oscillatoria sp. SIO1A7]|nr:hypothetical protein [Oscillatoria sp. SIO1A7]
MSPTVGRASRLSLSHLLGQAGRPSYGKLYLFLGRLNGFDIRELINQLDISGAWLTLRRGLGVGTVTGGKTHIARRRGSGTFFRRSLKTQNSGALELKT